MDAQAYYNHSIKTIQYKLYNLSRDLNQGQFRLQNGVNPEAYKILEVEEYINFIFSDNDDDKKGVLGALDDDFVATLSDDQKRKITDDRNGAMKSIDDMKRGVRESYNNFHHGASNVLDMDDAEHNESDDEAGNDIQGMGKPARAKLEEYVAPGTPLDQYIANQTPIHTAGDVRGRTPIHIVTN
jgi:hypothetical protein